MALYVSLYRLTLGTEEAFSFFRSNGFGDFSFTRIPALNCGRWVELEYQKDRPMTDLPFESVEKSFSLEKLEKKY